MDIRPEKWSMIFACFVALFLGAYYLWAYSAKNARWNHTRKEVALGVFAIFIAAIVAWCIAELSMVPPAAITGFAMYLMITYASYWHDGDRHANWDKAYRWYGAAAVMYALHALTAAVIFARGAVTVA